MAGKGLPHSHLSFCMCPPEIVLLLRPPSLGQSAPAEPGFSHIPRARRSPEERAGQPLGSHAGTRVSDAWTGGQLGGGDEAVNVCSSQDRLPGGGELWGDLVGGRSQEEGPIFHLCTHFVQHSLASGSALCLEPRCGRVARRTARRSARSSGSGTACSPGWWVLTRPVAGRAAVRPRVAGPTLRCTLPPSAG